MNEMSRAELSAVFPGTTILTRNGKHSTVPLYRSRRNALIERLGGRCVNCDERTSCNERNLGEDKYDVAAKCERWTNKRLTHGTKIYQKPWKRCPTDNAIMQKNVKTGESFCPLCKARKEREARR